MKVVLVLATILYTSLASAQIMRKYTPAGRGKPARGTNYNERTTIGDRYTNSNPNNSSSPRQVPQGNRGCNFTCKSARQNLQIDENTELAATILREHAEQAENLLRSLGATDRDIEFLSEIQSLHVLEVVGLGHLLEIDKLSSERGFFCLWPLIQKSLILITHPFSLF